MHGSIAAIICVQFVLAADMANPPTPHPAELPPKAAAEVKTKTEQPLDIEQRLQTQVEVHFQNVPLRNALENIAKQLKIPIYLDPKGFSAEGVKTDAMVTLDLRKTVMAKSALNLLLGPSHLVYRKKENVIWITSPSVYFLTTTFIVKEVAPTSEAMNRLLERIYAEVAPKSWDKAGGQGSIVQLDATRIRVCNVEEVNLELLDFILEEWRLRDKMTPKQKNEIEPHEENMIDTLHKAMEISQSCLEREP
jgi:hypothetical protein